jgi:uncharacterized repeat protein (TIGR03837 family)
MNVPPPAAPQTWEIFCQVVDNFGDIGVCWRLARDLASRDGLRVRLWVDDWASFARICPAGAGLPEAARRAGVVLQGVEVRAWCQPFAAVKPAEVVIEAFACELPPGHLQAMAGQAPPPVWINLEYLSAEDWVGGCHRMASPHPRLPLVKHFYFPGFDGGSGGLLREAGLLAARDDFRRMAGGRAAQLAALGLAPVADDALLVSLFAYEQPAVGALIGAWAAGAREVVLLVPEGRVVVDVARALGRETLAAGERLSRGRLEVRILPFTEQDAYDRLLWACGLNFVRGEDSFVRAQWAARPFVWQIYPQADGAHVGKLDAFLDRHCAGLAEPAATALRRFWHAWNGDGEPAAAWPAFAAALPRLAAHQAAWCARLAAQDDLVSQLVQFCVHISRRNG